MYTYTYLNKNILTYLLSAHFRKYRNNKNNQGNSAKSTDCLHDIVQ